MREDEPLETDSELAEDAGQAMSNHLAVAAVTATLRRNLQMAFDADRPSVGGATVVHVRPNAPLGLPDTGASVFLYQVTPNVAGRNADTPTRGPDGTLLKRPRAALDLHYLISFYGDDTKLEPQMLLASAVRTLHAQPVLEREAILQMIGDPQFAFVKDTDLAEAPDPVRFTPTSLSLEELSKLWSVFFQTPYALSVSYLASMVFVDSQLVARSAPLPVRAPVVVAAPSRLPFIEAVRSRSAPGAPILADQPILAGHTLVLAGRELAAAITSVRLGTTEVVPSDATDEQVEAVLPAGLRAGPIVASVVHRIALGSPPVPHDSVTSNLVAFMLAPQISAAQLAPGTLRVSFTPDLAPRQQVSVLLNELSPAPGSAPRVYRFDAHTAVDSATIDVAIAGVVAATYLVRSQVDGAESPLHYDTGTGRYDLPTVTIT
jgi:hypothetical protein